MIIKRGINALDPIEPIAGMDTGEVKEKYGDKICVGENVDCSGVVAAHRICIDAPVARARWPLLVSAERSRRLGSALISFEKVLPYTAPGIITYPDFSRL